MRKLLLNIVTILICMIIAACSGSDNRAGASKKQVYSGVVGSSFQVSNALNNEEQPAIAYDRDGRYFAVWTDYQNSTLDPAQGADIYGKICDGSGTSTGLNAKSPECGTAFEIATGIGDQWQPKVAYDYNSNKYLVVFADTSAGYSIIKGRLITQAEANAGDGVIAAPAFKVSTHINTAEKSQTEPEVIYNSLSKKFTVGWLASSNFDTADYPASDDTSDTISPTWKADDTKTFVGANAIISVTLPDGTPVTGYTVTPTPDSSTTTSVITLGSASNAVGKSGDITVNYADTTKKNNGTKDSTTVFAANDSFVIAPAGSQSSLALVYFFFDINRVIPATNVQQVISGNNINAAILSGSTLVGQPTAYYTSYGLTPGVWNSPVWRSGSSVVIGNVYSGANDNIADSNYKVSIVDSSSVDRTSDFIIVISGNVLSATLKNTSTLIGVTPAPDVTVTYRPVKTLMTSVTGQGCPNSYGPINYPPSNHVGTSLIAYSDVSSTGIVTEPQFPYSQLVLNEMVDSGSAITITATVTENESKQRLSYNPLDGEAFMLWSGTQHPETIDIKYTKDSFGFCTYSPVYTRGTDTTQKIILRRWINSLATDTLLGNSAFYPSISVDSSAKRFLVAWEEQNSATFATTGKDINAQFFDLTNFVLYGSLINVSDAVGDQTSPAAAYDTVNQRHLIIWEDARNQSANLSNIDIYGQFVDTQGNLSGGNVPINVDEGNQLSPTVSFGDANYSQFLLLWKDARLPDNSDIYGQLLKYSVLPQLVVTDSSDIPILNGALDFSNVAVGQILDKHIKLRNDGNATLTVSSMSVPSSPFSFLTPAPVNISPGFSYDMTVRFAPTSAGSYTGNPSNSFKTDILSNGGNTTLYFIGTGDGINTLSITTSSIADTTPDVSQDTVLATLAATGGVYPTTWDITLPAGLTLGTNVTFDTATGKLTQLASGKIPIGTYPITFTVTDSNNPKSTSDPRTLTLKVGNISIVQTQLSSWTLGEDYSKSPFHSLTAVGASSLTLTWALADPTVKPPLGIDFNPDGTLTGYGTSTGQYSFGVTVTDDSGQTATSQFSITINPAPSILTTSLPAASVGAPYSQTISITGGTLPITWSIAGGLPAGILFDAGKGIISGTPSSIESKDIKITALDASGASVTKDLNITVNGALGIATPTSGTGSPSAAIVGTAYNFVMKSNNGGVSPYTWSTTNGALPAGLTLDVNTGVIDGTPTTAGEYSFTVQLQDSVGTTTTKTYTIQSVATGSTLSVQLISSTGNVASVSSTPTSALTSVPTGVTPASATNMSIDGVTSGSTITVAVTFPSLPQNPVFYTVDGTEWTAFTPDSISGNAIFFKIKDRISAAETGLALRDSNVSAGIVDTSVVVATASSAQVSGGTVGSVSSSGGGKSGCFIATAAYGSYLDPHVKVLRNFRDDVLLQSRMGTAFVKFYYTHSPPIADYISQHETLRTIFRLLLAPVILLVKLGWISPGALFIALAVWVYRSRRNLIVRFYTKSVG